MIKCVKCGNPNNEDDSLCCTNCGFPLHSNYCTNEYCNRNNGEQTPLPEDACYCDLCGNESEYFRDGLIRPNSF